MSIENISHNKKVCKSPESPSPEQTIDCFQTKRQNEFSSSKKKKKKWFSWIPFLFFPIKTQFQYIV